MANVMFKRGTNLTNLPIVDGQFIIKTDERGIYVDVGTERLRIGDFIKVANIAALPASGASETALYYVEDINCLAKWNGTSWIQINKDSGAVNFTVTGEGNAITSVSYDADTRTLTLTKGATFATPADVDGKISDKVGDLTIGEEQYATVKAYVDKKTDGIATDTALETLTGRVTTVENKVEVLNGDKTTAGSVAKAIADLQGDTEETVAAVDARVCTIEDNYVDQYAIDTSIGNAIGTNPDNKTVAELIADAKAAATYDDTAVRGLISTNASAIADVKEDVDAFLAAAEVGEAAVDTLKEIQEYITADGAAAAEMTAKITANETAITAEKTRAEGAEATLTTAVNAVQADVNALDPRVTAVEGKAHEHANKALLDTYTQTEANLADAVAKKHEHANATVLDGITATKVSKWDATEQNANKYTDDQIEAYTLEMVGTINDGLDEKADKATTLAGYNIGDAYTKTETEGKISEALSWGSF